MSLVRDVWLYRKYGDKLREGQSRMTIKKVSISICLKVIKSQPLMEHFAHHLGLCTSFYIITSLLTWVRHSDFAQKELKKPLYRHIAVVFVTTTLPETYNGSLW